MSILGHVIISNFRDAHWVLILIDSLLLLLCLSATWFYCYVIYAAIDFFCRPNPIDLDFHPPVTILKPICGLDSDAYQNLASFCQQNYPEYQIILGVRDRQDAAVEVVQKIIYNFPNIDIQLL